MNKPDKQAIDQADTGEPHLTGKTSFLEDFLASLEFLSRLPVKVTKRPPLAIASRAFGAVGLVLGALTGLLFWLAISAGLSTGLAVVIALAAHILLTGGLHEDGLADVADGFGGGWTVARKLEIMRDSAVGTYGVLALIFAVGLRVTAYNFILESQSGAATGLLASVGLFAGVACISRAAMAFMMYQLPLARGDGRAAQAGSPSHDNLRQGLFISAVAGGAVLMLFGGITVALAAFAGAALAYLIVSRATRRQIGGYTGDVLGSLQQITEILALIAIGIII